MARHAQPGSDRVPLIAALVIAATACSIRAPELAVTRPRTAEVTARVAPSTPVSAYAPEGDATSIQGPQLQALRGLTVEQARRRLRALGHSGKVSVGSVLHFDPACGFDKVCETNRDGGCSVEEDLELHLNVKQEITGPRE